MKRLVWLLVLTPIVSCSPSQPLTQQRLFALSDGQFKVDGTTTDLSSALSLLGPPDTTQVHLIACPDLEFTTIQDVKLRVEAMGYERIGFASPSESERRFCWHGL